MELLVCTCGFMCVYIYRGRERERLHDICKYIHMYIYMYIYTHSVSTHVQTCIGIFIYL